MPKHMILASASERRSSILRSCGIRHTVVPSAAVENCCEDAALVRKIVEDNARAKSRKVTVSLPPGTNALVLGADTLVVCGDNVVGKPLDEQEARMMLKKFSGADIKVYTALSIEDTSSGRSASCVEVSGIRVAVLDDAAVDRIFPLLGPYDKAGGFSIEGVGSMIFDDIDGSYFNILGLPMIRLKELFCEVGEDILDYVNVL